MPPPHAATRSTEYGISATDARSFVLCMQVVLPVLPSHEHETLRAHQHLQEGCVKDERGEVFEPLQPCLCKPRGSCCAVLRLRNLLLRQHGAGNSQADQGTPTQQNGDNSLVAWHVVVERALLPCVRADRDWQMFDVLLFFRIHKSYGRWRQRAVMLFKPQR